MLHNFCSLFLMFIIYSVIGYLVEVFFCTLNNKKLTINRGFLIGPYLPIYGLSSVLMYIFLVKYKNDLIVFFTMSCLICSVMEFFTSLILEKIFKVRWWDYSHMKFNLDGRICLNNSILFGIGGIGLCYIINPIVTSLLNIIPKFWLILITSITLIIFITDLITSIVILIEIKVSSRIFSKKDVSEEVIKLRNERLQKNSLLFTRVLNAFPKLTGKNMEKYNDLKKKTNELRSSLKKNKKEQRSKKKKNHLI